MKLRKVIFWLHLTAGVFAGIVVFIMSVTGVALMYEKQMIEWADRGFRSAPPAADQKRLPVETLISKFREAQPDARPAAITIYSDPAAPAMVAAGQSFYVNPYTGVVLGQPSEGIRTFFRFVTSLHRYVAASNENRAIGKAITGACNLAFLFIVCSGIYLWFPRVWTWQSVRPVVWFKGGITGKARDFNWHNTFGFWTALPLFFVVLSASVISYPWASNLVYRLMGSPVPAPNAQAAGSGNRERQAPDLAQIETLLAQAEQQVPGWRSINLRFPTSEAAPLTFAIDQGNGGQPQLRSTLTLDQQTGQVVTFERYEDQNLGRRVRTWLRFVHTGEFYGIAGQTVAGIASAAGAVLVFTGLSLAYRRLSAWLGRRVRSRKQRIAGDAILEP